MTGYVIDSHDRLHGLRTDRDEDWEMKCVFSGSTNLRVHPIGVPYRPHTISDFSDLPPDMASYYKSLPHIVDAIINIIDGKEKNGYIVVENVDTGESIIGFKNRKGSDYVDAIPNKRLLKSYLTKFYGVEEVMIL